MDPSPQGKRTGAERHQFPRELDAQDLITVTGTPCSLVLPLTSPPQPPLQQVCIVHGLRASWSQGYFSVKKSQDRKKG